MQIFCYGNYVYTRSEKLCTCSGEVLYTREHKATLSKGKPFKYIDIDELKIFRNMYSKDEMVLKTKKKQKGLIDKINNKLYNLKWNKMLEKFNETLEKKINLINELIIFKLKIYFHDLGPGLDEIDAKIVATADYALNLICSMIGKKNRKRLRKINMDKKTEFLDRACDLLKHIISEIQNETDEIYTKMCNVNRLDKDGLNLINDKPNEIKTQTKKKHIKN